MQKPIQTLVNWFIPENLKSDPDLHYRVRLLVVFGLASIPTAPLFSLVLRQAPLPLIVTPLLGAVIGAISLFTLRKTGSYILAANLFIFSLALSTFIGVLISGGIRSPVALVLVIHPMVDIYIAGIYSGVIWTLCSAAYLALLYLLDLRGIAFPIDPVIQNVLATYPVMLLLTIFISLLLSILYERIRVQLYRQLRGQQQVLVNSSKMAALGEMAGGVAHEINNPLAIIGTVVDCLKDEVAEGNLDKNNLLQQLTVASDTVTRAAKIVIGLRSFSRDAQSDPFEVVSVKQIIEDTLSLCSEKFKEAGVDIVVVPAPTSATLSCRRIQISQVLLNLLSNAFDATAGQPVKWVKIEALVENNAVEVCISNNGPAIPEKIRNKIFQPFFTTKEIGKGTGLGLSVSKGIVESHHGTLVLDETSEQTRFLIRIPKENN